MLLRGLFWIIILFFVLAALRSLMEQASRHARSSRPNPGTTSRRRHALGILGLREGASQEEIRRAYKERAAAYHPDRVAHLGPELVELTSEKFKEIKQAYEYLARP